MICILERIKDLSCEKKSNFFKGFLSHGRLNPRLWERLNTKKTVKSYADCEKGFAAPKLNGNGVIYDVIPIKHIYNRN